MSISISTIPHFACVALACAALGCAPRVQTTQLTSAELSARMTDEASGAVRGGDYTRALSAANEAVALSPSSPWAHYDRAIALHALGRTAEAADDYQQAQWLFGDNRAWERSISIYGRARAFDDAGQCAPARRAYEQYATFARSLDPRGADLALEYGKHCRDGRPTSVLADRTTSDVTVALVAGDYRGALSLADGAIARQRAGEVTPWLTYNRAVALANLGRTDEAVDAFRSAEQQFGDDEANRHGRAVSVYGRARALEGAGRCTGARQAYAEYAASVRTTSPGDAEAALAAGRRCGAVP